jgi:hypothetical protein
MCMALDEIVAKEKIWILSAAEVGAKPNYGQLSAMETYAKRTGADIGVIPIVGQHFDAKLHPDFEKYTILSSNYRLNKHISVRHQSIRSQQINPLTGLRRFGQTNHSFIVGSPKQQLEHIPNSPKYYPKAIMSTGACTLPNYMQNRIGLIAQDDHKQGGVIVKLFEDNTFIFRHFTCAKDGSFQDYDTVYKPDGKTAKERIDTLIVGDLHYNMLSTEAWNGTVGQIHDLKPKYIVLHDVFDGASVNHHERHKVVSRSKSVAPTLAQELGDLHDGLHELLSHAPKDAKIYVVKSNHDEFLDRYLEEGEFVKDYPNAQLGFQLAHAMSRGHCPLHYGLEVVKGKLDKRIVFLERDDDFRRFGYLLSMHGDKGPRGTRGNMVGLEYSVGKGFVAHDHSAAIFRDVYRVGTCSDLNPSYTKGSPSNWTRTNGAISSQGKPQLLPIIQHRYF